MAKRKSTEELPYRDRSGLSFGWMSFMTLGKVVEITFNFAALGLIIAAEFLYHGTKQR